MVSASPPPAVLGRVELDPLPPPTHRPGCNHPPTLHTLRHGVLCECKQTVSRHFPRVGQRGVGGGGGVGGWGGERRGEQRVGGGEGGGEEGGRDPNVLTVSWDNR